MLKHNNIYMICKFSHQREVVKITHHHRQRWSEPSTSIGNSCNVFYNFIMRDIVDVLLLSILFKSNFNYCPLVWHFCSAQSVWNLEKIQERALRLLYNDNVSSYEHILANACKPIRRLRLLALEIFKTLNDLNPIFIK